ncbi:MAG: hypothetical protein R3C10_19570 [Pirellulales bacterium]
MAVAKAAKKSSKQTSATVTVDRRNPKSDRRKQNVPVAAGKERRKVQRRRQIDPTTCERDYSDAEVEFMRALDEYKRASGRMFPTCSEILEVIAKLGYEKRSVQASPAAEMEGDAEDALNSSAKGVPTVSASVESSATVSGQTVA